MKNRRHTGSVYDCGIIGFPVFRDVRYLNALCRGRIKNNLPASCRRKAGIAVMQRISVLCIDGGVLSSSIDIGAFGSSIFLYGFSGRLAVWL